MTHIPSLSFFDARHRAKARTTFAAIAAEKGPLAAHVRLWIAWAMAPAALVLAVWAIYAGQARGKNIAEQVTQNTHALICHRMLRPYPPDYQPAFGMPVPTSAPCTDLPETAGPRRKDAP